MAAKSGYVIAPGKWMKYRSILVVLGGILVHLVLGAVGTYGNMAPYLVSYLRARGSSSTLSYEKASWIVSSRAISQAIGLFIVGLIESKIGPRLTVLIGCLSYSGGMALTYITLDNGFIYVVLTYAVMPGIGIAMSYYVPIGCVMRWFPTRKGLVCGLVVGGFGGGAFVFNPIITAFINPKNLSPDIQVDKNYFFSQAEVLDQVPRCMLLLSGIYITVQIIGVIFIHNPPELPTLTADEQKIAVFTIDKTIKESAAENGKISKNVTSSHEQMLEKKAADDMTTWQMLKTKTFYHLWLLMFCNTFSGVLIGTVYKTYGQTFIHDDYFLSMVGASASVFNASGRVVWGLLLDYTSFQILQMCLTASITCLFSLFVISELGGKAFFIILVCSMFFFFSGSFSTFPSISMKCFGSKHYTANYGLLCTAIATSIMSTSFVSQFFFKLIGYHGLFFIGAGVGFIGCFLAFLFREPKNKQL